MFGQADYDSTAEPVLASVAGSEAQVVSTTPTSETHTNEANTRDNRKQTDKTRKDVGSTMATQTQHRGDARSVQNKVQQNMNSKQRQAPTCSDSGKKAETLLAVSGHDLRPTQQKRKGEPKKGQLSAQPTRASQDVPSLQPEDVCPQSRGRIGRGRGALSGRGRGRVTRKQADSPDDQRKPRSALRPDAAVYKPPKARLPKAES